MPMTAKMKTWELRINTSVNWLCLGVFGITNIGKILLRMQVSDSFHLRGGLQSKWLKKKFHYSTSMNRYSNFSGSSVWFRKGLMRWCSEWMRTAILIFKPRKRSCLPSTGTVLVKNRSDSKIRVIIWKSHSGSAFKSISIKIISCLQNESNDWTSD